MALWKIKQEPSTIHALVEVLRGGDRLSQFRAMMSLELIGPLAKEAVPTLMGILTREHGYVRTRAAEVLGRIGPAADPCAPALTAALDEDDGQLRIASALALWRICRSERGLAILIRELKSGNESTR